MDKKCAEEILSVVKDAIAEGKKSQGLTPTERAWAYLMGRLSVKVASSGVTVTSEDFPSGIERETDDKEPESIEEDNQCSLVVIRGRSVTIHKPSCAFAWRNPKCEWPKESCVCGKHGQDK